MSSPESEAAPRVGWKAHARSALRNADPWSAWFAMRDAPREEIRELGLDVYLAKLIGKLIAKTEEVDALGDLFRLAAESGAAGDMEDGGRRTVPVITTALARIASDEEAPASVVFAALTPLATARDLDSSILDLILDVFEVVANRASVDESREFLVSLLAGCRQREYRLVSEVALRRMLAFGEELL